MTVRILGLLFTFICGTILHFTYQLSNKNKLVGLFSATNESTFEHIKMGLSARLMYFIIELHFLSSNTNYYFSIMIELLIITVTIPLLFYGYKLITKKSILIFDIAIFYLAILTAAIAGIKVLMGTRVGAFINYHSIIVIILFIGAMIFYTLKPTHNFLFKDPITKKYGMK